MRILSGIQPTGQFHLGNYLGALRHWVNLQNQGNECFYPIVDLHALTTVHDAEALRKNTEEAQFAMLAMGFDPKKSALFLQSQVPAHTELAWILTTLTPIGDLERMTQYKEKSQQVSKNAGVNAGLLAYPTLMAADILLYNPDYVPVGEDQKQHLEFTRNIAEKFNKTYGEVFKLPKAMIQKETARVMSLHDPSKKMSKSLGPQHYIGLFENEKSIRDKIKRAVTDSGKEIKYDPQNKPAISNMLAIYSGITGKSIKDLELEFTGVSYVEFKSKLADALMEHLRPMQARYSQLSQNSSDALAAFEAGAEKARRESEKTMKIAREKVGLR
ncbi:MAG: tryptophan--tRNA ligase [Candidatus Spechtbacterales bacterium]